MIDLRSEIDATDLAGGSVALWWLGQAGYALKTPSGTVALIDAYLSNVVEELYGQPRLVPQILDAATARADVVFATHWHEDHFDTGSIGALAANPGTIFVGPPSVAARLAGRRIAPERIVTVHRGETVAVRDFKITGTFARHEVAGFLAEDALGLLLEVSGLRIYHSGDTEYDARLRPIAESHPDVVMLCMNGSGGCMNAYEAALLAWQLAPKIVYPNHFGMWAPEHYGRGATLDPALFSRTYRRLGGTGDVRIPAVGVCEHLDARQAGPVTPD